MDNQSISSTHSDKSGSRTSTARRSRAERAKAERERRRRSLSRSRLISKKKATQQASAPANSQSVSANIPETSEIQTNVVDQTGSTGVTKSNKLGEKANKSANHGTVGTSKATETRTRDISPSRNVIRAARSGNYQVDRSRSPVRESSSKPASSVKASNYKSSSSRNADGNEKAVSKQSQRSTNNYQQQQPNTNTLQNQNQNQMQQQQQQQQQQQHQTASSAKISTAADQNPIQRAQQEAGNFRERIRQRQNVQQQQQEELQRSATALAKQQYVGQQQQQQNQQSQFSSRQSQQQQQLPSSPSRGTNQRTAADQQQSHYNSQQQNHTTYQNRRQPQQQPAVEHHSHEFQELHHQITVNDKNIQSAKTSSNQQKQQPPPPPAIERNPSMGSASESVNTNNPFSISSTHHNPSNTSHNNNNRKQNSNETNTKILSVESPLPPLVQRCLGDRSYEKRKNAALEVEQVVKSLAESAILGNNVNNASTVGENGAANTVTSQTSPGSNHDPRQMIASLIAILSKDFCQSMNSNFRKGGLIGLAATSIGLLPSSQIQLQQQQQNNSGHGSFISVYLESIIKPVLTCFDDPESRVRYYACESLYNIIKVARHSILPHFNQIFDGLTKLFADVDGDVKNGANLLDRLVKDIVTESEDFSVDQFLPLLQNYIRRTNPYIRQLLVGWITVLDGIPDIDMIDYLPDFLDGLFNMLSDSNREIRQAADSALSEFLREVRNSAVVEFGPIVSILVFQCHSKERLNRLTAITWLIELIHHPHSGGDELLPYHADVLGAIMTCISDVEVEIRKVAEKTNGDFLSLVKDTEANFELKPLLNTLTKELLDKQDVPTKMAALRWINMLMEKRRKGMDDFIQEMLPVLLESLSDPSDAVVLLTVQVLSRISLSHKSYLIRKDATSPVISEKERDNAQFEMVVKVILKLFASNRRLLETRGPLIVRRLCVLLNAKSVYIIMADIISSYDLSSDNRDIFTLEFVATMVQTLNLILLTATELHYLRQLLAKSFGPHDTTTALTPSSVSNKVHKYAFLHSDASNASLPKSEGAIVFAALFHTWCHNPVATFSLCLLARAYDVAFALVKKFSELEVTVGFLMQIDKLVHMLESPIFVHLRLQLLDVEAPHHTYLLKSCYGLLMLLPQSEAFRSLNDRLASVCNLRDNLGVRPNISASPLEGVIKSEESSIYQAGLDAVALLERFDEVMRLHQNARAVVVQRNTVHQTENNSVGGASLGGNGGAGSVYSHRNEENGSVGAVEYGNITGSRGGAKGHAAQTRRNDMSPSSVNSTNANGRVRNLRADINSAVQMKHNILP